MSEQQLTNQPQEEVEVSSTDNDVVTEEIQAIPKFSPIDELKAEIGVLNGKVRTLKWTVGVMATLAIGIASVFTLNLLNQERFVMFNVKDTTNNFLKQVAQLNLDENQKKNLVVRYQRNLNDIVKGYQEQGIIVLSTSAILTPVEDKTSEIKAEISKRMRVKPKQEEVLSNKENLIQ